jgi:hypothetical protein
VPSGERVDRKTRRRRKALGLMVAPLGAPFPRAWPEGKKESPPKPQGEGGRDYGVPGAEKNTGDDACLIETWLFDD